MYCNRELLAVDFKASISVELWRVTNGYLLLVLTSHDWGWAINHETLIVMIVLLMIMSNVHFVL